MNPPPPKRWKGRVPQSNSEAMLLCSQCFQVDIGPSQPSFFIGCNDRCQICAHCFSELMTTPFEAPSFCCPTCNASGCKSWTCKSTISRISRRGTRTTTSQVHNGRMHPRLLDQEMDAPRTFKKDYGSREHDGYVSISFLSNKEGEVAVGNAVYCVTDDASNWGADQIHLLEDLLQFLHCTAVANDMVRGPHAPALDASTSHLITINGIRSAALLDYSLLHRLVFSLAYGERLLHHQRGVRPEDTRFQTLLCTTSSVTDMIRHVRSKRPGYVKIAVSAQLQAYSSPKQVYEILNQIGVCCSYQTNRRKTLKELATKLDEGINALIKAGRHDMLVFLFDNIGYRMGGGHDRVGYLHMIVLVIAVIRKEDLIKYKIYPDPSGPGNQQLLSRTPNAVWCDVRSQDAISYEKVLGPRTADYSLLGETVFTIFDTVLALSAKGLMFSHEDAETMLEENQEWVCELPDLFGSRRLIGQDADSTTSQEIGYEHASGSTSSETHFDANDATVDNAINADLSTKTALLKLYEYAKRLTAMHLGQPCPPGWESVVPIARELHNNLNCDGAPTQTMNRMILEGTMECQLLVAGFHANLTAHKVNGKLHGWTHLFVIFGCWRFSEGQLKWVFDPGDPGQIQDELIMCMFGIAADCTAQLRMLREATTAKTEQFEISASDVVDYMLLRAKLYPAVHLFVLTFPIAGLTFMLRNAESAGDTDAYLGCLRILNQMCASSHMTGYVFNITEFFVDWFCMSDADRKITGNALLFRKTSNGATIFSDRFVEWTVRYLRMTTGKKASSRDYATVVQRAALFLNERCRVKKESKREANKTKNRDTEYERGCLKMDRPMQESFLFCRDANLFGPGVPKYVPGIPWSKRCAQDPETWKKVDVEDGVMTPDGKKAVNPETFFFLSTGADRAKRYFDTFAKNGDRKNTVRSEKESEGGVCLSLIEPRMAALNETKKNEVDKFVSVSTEFLQTRGIITAKELNSDLLFLNQQLPLKDRVKKKKNDKGNTDKTCLIESVISARQKLIDRDASWIASRKLQIAPVETDREDSLAERRAKELDTMPFTFRGTISRQKYSMRKHKFQGTMASAAATTTTEGGDGDEDDNIDEVVVLRESESSTMTGVTDASSPSTGPFSNLGFRDLRQVYRKQL